MRPLGEMGGAVTGLTAPQCTARLRIIGTPYVGGGADGNCCSTTATDGSIADWLAARQGNVG